MSFEIFPLTLIQLIMLLVINTSHPTQKNTNISGNTRKQFRQKKPKTHTHPTTPVRWSKSVVSHIVAIRCTCDIKRKIFRNRNANNLLNQQTTQTDKMDGQADDKAVWNMTKTKISNGRTAKKEKQSNKTAKYWSHK